MIRDDISIDTGCNLHPACLTCPLAVCKYDIPREYGRSPALLEAKALVIGLRAQGKPIAEIVAKTHRSQSTVMRYLREAKA